MLRTIPKVIIALLVVLVAAACAAPVTVVPDPGKSCQVTMAVQDTGFAEWVANREVQPEAPMLLVAQGVGPNRIPPPCGGPGEPKCCWECYFGYLCYQVPCG